MKKHKVSALVALGLLALAVVVGAWALSSRDVVPDRAGVPAAAVPSTHAPVPPPGTVTTRSGRTSKATKDAHIVIPEGAVDPTRGSDYCATVKLLAIYAQQSYGLNGKRQAVNGKKFDARLRVIAATYARLADQATTQPRAGAVSANWQALADATSAAEEALRVTGLQADSQAMYVPLAVLAKAMADNLPVATKTLRATCGLSPAILGL